MPTLLAVVGALKPWHAFWNQKLWAGGQVIILNRCRGVGWGESPVLFDCNIGFSFVLCFAILCVIYLWAPRLEYIEGSGDLK